MMYFELYLHQNITTIPNIMKRFFTLLFAIFAIVTICLAQTVSDVDKIKYEIKDRTGVLYPTDSLEEYYIVECPGMTSAQLFNNVMDAAILTFGNNCSIVKNDNRTLLIQTKSYIGGLTIPYTLIFQFKDGKIKVNNPKIDYAKIPEIKDYRIFFNSLLSEESDKFRKEKSDFIQLTIQTLLHKSVGANDW